MSLKTNPFAKIINGPASDQEKIQAMAQLLVYDVKKTPAQNQKRVSDFNELMDHLKQERDQVTGGIFQALQGKGQADKAAEADQPSQGGLRELLSNVKSEGVSKYLSKVGKGFDELTEANNVIKHDYELLEAAARDAARRSQEQRDILITAMDGHVAAATAAAKEAQTTTARIKETASRLKTTLSDKETYKKAGETVTSTAETAAMKMTATVAKGALKTAWFLTKTAGGAVINSGKPKKKPGSGPSR